MRVLVVGNGAREDALSWALERSPSCTMVATTPGNAGTAQRRGGNWEIAATDGRAIVERALAERIDLVVLGPETAIAAGVGDRLRDAGIPVFGPNRAAGRLETSKVYSKRFMERYGIPTARARVIHSLEAARRELATWRGGVVVKADGLAAGKGVVVVDTAAEALSLLEGWYGDVGIPGGGNAVLLEERLSGREVSLFAIGDGLRFLPFGSACDYKRAGEGDTGPNTGGMGAYSPPLDLPVDLIEEVERVVLLPLQQGLAAEGERYLGVIYCGLMLTETGPQVIEFNVRFGDPETQVLMPRVTGDLAALMRSAATGRLDPQLASLSERACVGVVLASQEYPVRSTPIVGLPADVGPLDEGVALFWGGSRHIPTSNLIDAQGGRVLTVTACGVDVADARARAYAAVEVVAKRFGRRELSYRRDIAANVATLAPPATVDTAV